MQVVVNLPETVVERVKIFSHATKRDVSAVLADTVEMMWPAWEMVLTLNVSPPVETLPDEEVLRLADLKMDPQLNERLGDLQIKGKTATLEPSEQVELLTLIHLYQMGQLRKSEGLAEAVHRGLRPPLPA